MKKILIFLLIATLCFCNCVHATNNQNTAGRNTVLETIDYQKDILEIQKLIKQVINWSESPEAIIIDPVLIREGSYYFDKQKLERNLEKLRETGFFSTEFIENYNQLILTLDRKLRNKEFDEWTVGDLPPFKFANDFSPWCMCQGFSTEEFDSVEIIKMDNKSGELIWKWKEESSWINFKFKVVYENNRWRISYLQGFDYKEGIKKNVEIKSVKLR